MDRKEAIEQLTVLGRERVDLSPLCDILVGLLETYAVARREGEEWVGERSTVAIVGGTSSVLSGTKEVRLTSSASTVGSEGGFDRERYHREYMKKYMRDYMRKWREKKKKT